MSGSIFSCTAGEINKLCHKPILLAIMVSLLAINMATVLTVIYNMLSEPLDNTKTQEG